MSDLDKDIRLFIEEQVDSALTDPGLDDSIQIYLSIMGIIPNLETKLSLMTGILLGSAMTIFGAKQGLKEESAGVSDERFGAFIQEVTELVARRAMELRQLFYRNTHL